MSLHQHIKELKRLLHLIKAQKQQILEDNISTKECTQRIHEKETELQNFQRDKQDNQRLLQQQQQQIHQLQQNQ